MHGIFISLTVEMEDRKSFIWKKINVVISTLAKIALIRVAPIIRHKYASVRDVVPDTRLYQILKIGAVDEYQTMGRP